MESIVRDVNCIEEAERLVYESVLGHRLRENQRILIRVIDAEGELNESARRASLGRAVEIARKGRAAVEAQGISTAEADDAIDEAIRESHSAAQ